MIGPGAEAQVYTERTDRDEDGVLEEVERRRGIRLLNNRRAVFNLYTTSPQSQSSRRVLDRIGRYNNERVMWQSGEAAAAMAASPDARVSAAIEWHAPLNNDQRAPSDLCNGLEGSMFVGTTSDAGDADRWPYELLLYCGGDLNTFQGIEWEHLIMLPNPIMDPQWVGPEAVQAQAAILRSEHLIPDNGTNAIRDPYQALSAYGVAVKRGLDGNISGWGQPPEHAWLEPGQIGEAEIRTTGGYHIAMKFGAYVGQTHPGMPDTHQVPGVGTLTRLERQMGGGD